MPIILHTANVAYGRTPNVSRAPDRPTHLSVLPHNHIYPLTYPLNHLQASQEQAQPTEPRQTNLKIQ